MTPEQASRLAELDDFVTRYARAGKTRRQFWAEFDALAGDLGTLAFADAASPELREHYCEVLANADDAGFAGPEGELDDVMED